MSGSQHGGRVLVDSTHQAHNFCLQVLLILQSSACDQPGRAQLWTTCTECLGCPGNIGIGASSLALQISNPTLKNYLSLIRNVKQKN